MMSRFPKEENAEKNLPTQTQETHSHPRVSQSNANPSRAQNPKTETVTKKKEINPGRIGFAVVLSYNHRLPARTIPQLLQAGRKLSTPHLQLFVDKQTTPAPSQLAIVVPVRIDKRAVIRNKLKRKLREAIRETETRLVLGKRAVLLVNKKVDGDQWLRLEREVAELLFRAGLIISHETTR